MKNQEIIDEKEDFMKRLTPFLKDLSEADERQLRNRIDALVKNCILSVRNQTSNVMLDIVNDSKLP